MASGKTLYIKGDRDVEVTKPDVTLADLLSMELSLIHISEPTRH